MTAYLGRHGIVPSRTTDHMVLFLFSVGITKGKWGTLLNTLLDFKNDYDRNAPLAQVLPNIVAAAPDRYAGMGLKDLGDELWAHMKKNRQGHWQAQAYATLPKPEMTPRRAFQRLMAGDAEKVPLDKDGEPRRRGRRDPLPARHSDRDAGRERRRGRRSLDHLPAHAAGVRSSFPGFAKEVEGDRGAGRRLPHLLRQKKSGRAS